MKRNLNGRPALHEVEQNIIRKISSYCKIEIGAIDPLAQRVAGACGGAAELAERISVVACLDEAIACPNAACEEVSDGAFLQGREASGAREASYWLIGHAAVAERGVCERAGKRV